MTYNTFCCVRTENSLSRLFDSIESTFSKHVIIYTGSTSPSTFTKRQEDSTDSQPQPLKPFVFAPSNGTTFSGGTGILGHYQLLTPGLIITLAVTLFLLIPVIGPPARGAARL